jgi:hypothetical protein
MMADKQPLRKRKLNYVGAALLLLGALTLPESREYLGQLIPQEWLPRLMALGGLTVIVLRSFFPSGGGDTQ